MATIIASRSEEDLVGVERSESTSSGSSGEESSKPRPKRTLRITATDSSLGPVKEAGHGQDQHIREEGYSGSGRQRREPSVRSNGAVLSVCVRGCMSSASLSASPKPSCACTSTTSFPLDGYYCYLP